LAAGVSAAFGPGINRIGGGSIDIEYVAARVAVSATIGGTAAEISGGKFANGAVTAAFLRLYNEEQHRSATKRQGRPVTSREIREARKVYGDKIDYDEVRVINGKYLPWQTSRLAVTPNGKIYLPGAPSDFIAAGQASWFIHEMAHVMQHQHGVGVETAGFFLHLKSVVSLGTYNPYTVRYDPSRAFNTYNIEQQAKIAEWIYAKLYPNNINYSSIGR
jgi:hypothetical protein